MSWKVIYERVAGWNAARYDREFNVELLVKLLEEELKETTDAKTEVDILDGRCDQCYVALGGIWKLGIDDELMSEAAGFAAVAIEKAVLSGLTEFNASIGLNIQALTSKHLPDSAMQKAVILFSIVYLNHVAMEYSGLDACHVFEAMNIVCDSNDSKTVQKVAPDVKANIDKGAGFVRPEPALTELLFKVKSQGVQDGSAIH